MGKIVVSEFVTLDGVMQDPGGAEGTRHGGWAFRFERGPEGDKFKLDELMASDALLLGRVTYQGFAKAWPSMTDGQGFAGKMNSMPKYVVSTTLDTADWNNSTIIREDMPGHVARLKNELSGDILVGGSCTLARSLAQHGLVDEYRLMVYPVALGSGVRLFGESDSMTALSLVSAQPVGSGIIILSYRPLEQAAAGS